MKRWIAVAAILLAIVGAAYMLGRHKAPEPVHGPVTTATTIIRTADDVTSFNDGFTDAKRDDCQQGYQAACQWLAETK
jgi:hypothetical protein